MKANFKRTKFTCFYTYLALSCVFCLPSMLFVTFRETYGISYTLLGTLVLINFFTQLLIDLVFTFFSKHFDIRLTVRIMPLLTATGLTVYALSPFIFGRFVYVGLLIGTVIFSVAAGLCEVLLSPLVAALPSDNPERDMSALHSLYAYGVLTVVVISTLFLWLFGANNWMFLVLFWAVFPIGSFILFSISPIPDMNLSQNADGGKSRYKTIGLALCVACIFLGSASENTMTNWISGYAENALGLSKSICDVLGLAMFAVLLGLARTAYAKYGKNIIRVLLFGMIGAVACYLVAGLSLNPAVSLVACVLTGLCTSMLWPGTLIMMEEKLPMLGVTAYALMAAGGDFGGSVAPQLMGVVVDTVAASEWAETLSVTLSLSPEQIGMKTGMLIAAIFPTLGIVAVILAKRHFSKGKKA